MTKTGNRTQYYEMVTTGKGDVKLSDEEQNSLVNPSWFESPVERISTSGGTAPFFRLILTEEGLRNHVDREKHCHAIE